MSRATATATATAFAPVDAVADALTGSPAVTLRAAAPIDAGPLGAILSDFTDSADWMPRIHSRAEDIAHAGMLIDQGWVTVAESARTIHGFLAREDDEIHALYVACHATGGGIGKRLLDHAKAGRDRLVLWTLQANAGACRFYAREGFRELRRTRGHNNDEGLPDIRFLWERSRP